MPGIESKIDFEAEYARWVSRTNIMPIELAEAGVRGEIQGKYKGTPFAFEPGFEFRAGEVTVWAAQNGQGKSLLTGQIAMQLALVNEPVCMMSFEMRPRKTVYRMLRQWAGHRPEIDDIEPFMCRFGGKLFLLDHIGAISAEAVFGAIIVAVRDYKCRHVFVDNLMKVVFSETGDRALAEQKAFMQGACDLARGLDICIHVIHHVRKPSADREESLISKYDLKGSGSISDQADNIILLQRNRAKEREMETRSLSYEEDSEKGDVMLIVAKQRNGDFEGSRALWFNRQALAYCKDPGRIPLLPHRNDGPGGGGGSYSAPNSFAADDF